MNYVDGITEIYIDDLNMASYSNSLSITDANLQAQITALSNNIYNCLDIETSNLTVNSNLNVSGATTLTGQLINNGITTLNNNLTVYNADTVLAGTLIVNDQTTLYDNLVISNTKTLTCGGVGTFNNAVNITGTLTANGSAITNGTLTTNGQHIANGITTFNNDVTVYGSNTSLTCGGDLLVDGTTTFYDDVIISNVQTLTCGGIGTFNSAVNVSGTTTLNGSAITNSTLTANGISSFTKDVNMSSNLICKHLSVNSTDTNSAYAIIASGNVLSDGYYTNLGVYGTGIISTATVNASTINTGVLNVSTTSVLTGNVGIGTSASGSYKLDTYGNARVSGSLSIGTAGTDYSSLYLAGGYGDNSATYSGFQRRVYSGTEASELVMFCYNDFDDKIKLLSGQIQFDTFQTDGATLTSGTTRMTITNTGNVGIGTTEPIDALQIHGTYASSGLWEGDDGLTFSVHYGGAPKWIAGAICPYLASGGGNSTAGFGGGLLFRTSTASSVDTITKSSTAVRMVIDSQGYVGINKTNPSYQLDVSGASRLTGSLYFGNGAGDTMQSFCVNNLFNSYVGVYGATANATYPLNVNGNILCTHVYTSGSTSGSGTVNCGQLNAGTVSCSSLSLAGANVVKTNSAGVHICYGRTATLGVNSALNRGPISFGYTYASAPQVLLTGCGDDSFYMSVYSTTTTDFHYNFTNGGYAVTKYINWMAIGI